MKIVSHSNKDQLEYFAYFPTDGKKISAEDLTSFEGLITIFTNLGKEH